MKLHLNTPLFHWAPRERRKQIVRYGLRPAMRSTQSIEWKAPYVCFAESPSWAWALSAGMRKDVQDWDLWQTYYGVLTEPSIVPAYDKHIVHEVRTEFRVYKSMLWFVGERSQ